MKKTMRAFLFISMLFMIPFILAAQVVIITGDSTINQCETKSYTISIQNNSGNPLTNLVITALLQNFTGFSYVNGTTGIDVPGGCTADPIISGGYTGLCAPAPSAPYLTWDIDALCGGPFTLNSSNTLNISFALATDCDAVSGSLNTYIDYEMSGTPFCDKTGAHSIQVLPGGVTIKKTPNVIPQELWQNVTWTLTIENTGFGIIENVVVTDVLDTGLSYVSSSPAGVNAGQTTTWGTAEIPQFASMNPGDKITIDITAAVIACEFLENNADVRWGCDLITDCYNTANTIPPSTATASVQRIVKTPLIEYTPPDVSFNYCEDYVDVNFTVTNTGDGRAHDVWLPVNFGGLTVSDISAGAIYNAAQNRFELTNPLAAAPGPGNTYDLSFRLNYNTWCGGSFPSGDLLWQTVYKDDCDNEFYPPVKLSTVNAPANSPALSVGKTGAPSAIQIGSQITYIITSTYSGPLSCGSGSTGDITVVDTLPDGFTVLDAGGGTWVPGGGGTGGTITWTYTPPASLNTGITIQVPPATDCETYCFTTFTNTIQATGTDCCGCAMSANSSQSTAIECEELVDSEKTAVPTIGIRCDTIQYTNTYVFADNAALDTVDLSQLIFQENAENEQEYDPGSLAVTLSGSGDITACAQAGMTDTTPGAGGNLIINFSNCTTYGSIRNRTLTITYRLRITEATVGACSTTTFYSWSALDINLITGNQCLPDGIIYETTVVSVDPPAMSLSITGLGQIVHKCESQAITITLTQTSGTANPKDVRLVLSGLNYYVVNPAATVCSGVAPTSCTPTIVGNDYVWYFADGFTGGGQNAVLQLQVQKRCTGSGDLVATAYFDDNCNDDGNYDDTCSVTATETPALLLSGDLLIEKNPEVVYAAANTIQWKIYLTNRGSGTAYNVWFDDVLGAGLDYVSAVVDNMTGVTVTADQDHNGGAINGCTIAIAEMTAGQRREITFTALLIDCDNLTNDASTSWGCVGVDCQAAVTDSATVEIPRPLLINTNVVTTPADACSDPEGSITLRNAGQTTCYNLQITENLPTGLTYVPGTTRWRLTLNGVPGLWNGPDAAYDPVVSGSPEQMDWTSTQIAGLAVSNPGDTIEIEYDLHADCPFTGGNVTVGTSYENPCGQVFNTANSVFTVAFREPDVTITKTRANTPVGCGETVTWTIRVTNNSDYSLPIIWLEDTLGTAYTLGTISSTGDATYTGDSGTVNNRTVTWEITNLPIGITATVTVTADTDSSPCSPDLDDTVRAWWGCGAADGSSATKPGVDPPDNTLCLTTTAVTTTRTETRQPTVGYLDIALNPTQINACDDRSDLTVVIQNTGTTEASDLDLVITLPAGLTYIAGTSETCVGTDDTCTAAPVGDPTIVGNQLVYYNIGDKANDIADSLQADGGNDTLVLKFAVESNCYVTADMNFSIYYYDCCGDTQWNTVTNEPLTALYPDIDVTKTPDTTQVDCGANVTWTIQVTNNGTGNAEVVRIEDTLGNWVDYVNGSFTSTVPGLNIFNIAAQTYAWEFNNLGPGDTETFTIQGTLNPDAPQADCTAELRQNNVEVHWGCGTNADSIDNNPTTTAYTCEYPTTANAPAATLQMPDLIVTGLTPDIACTADGTFSGSIQVTVRNQGTGIAYGGFQVQVTDGNGWTGTGSYGSDLAAGAETTVSIDVTGWNPDCTPCTYNFNATVDSGDTVCECHEGNNDFGPQSYSPAIPDLEVASDTLAITCVVDGQYRISGTVTLRNAGCSGTLTQNVPVQFTLFSGAGCGGAQVAQWNQTFTGVSIAAGATQTFTITNYTILGNACSSASGCQFSIRTEADYTNTICECDGTDNTLCSDKNFTIPDLRVDSETLAISCSADGQIRIQGNLVVANDGCGANLVTNIPIRIRVYTNSAACSGANGNLVFTQGGVNIPAGGTQSFPVNRTLNRNLCTNSTGCQVAVGIELDYTSVICECTNANNNYCAPNKTVSIPDLQVTGDTLSVNCLQDGQVRVSGDVTIANTGCNAAVAGNLPVQFTLFSNTGCAGAQVAQWTETFAGANIAAGASQVFTITNRDIITNICTNSTGCQVSLRIVADPAPSTICECNGGNNTRCSNKTVSVPDLRITAVTPSITCTIDGTLTGTVQVTVNNNGCGAANNIPVRLTSDCGYIFTDQAILTLGAGASTTLTFNFTPDISRCTCTFTAAADPDNMICECDGTNNSLAAAPYTSPVPDLTITGIDFTNVTCANDNISGSVSVTVGNQGCGTANNFQVSLTTDGCLNFTDQTFVSLAAGASTTLTFNIGGSWADCLDGDCQFTAEVDAPGTVCEYDGTNNTRSETYNSTLPDLVVTDIDFSGITCANDNISGSVAVTINNQGFGNAANFQVSLATDGCLNFTNQTAANLAAGAGTTVTFNVSGSWADCTDCDCVFTAVVDPTNVVCECDGTNNNRVETYNFNLPDLLVNSVTPAATCVDDSNFQGTVTVNVSNTGCAAANNAVVRLTSSCGYVFADQTVNLAAGASANLVFTYTPTCPNCSCTFTATIDPDAAICECNGTNNTVTSAVFDLDVPDVTVEADTLGVTCATDGQVTVSGTVTLGNQGCGSNLAANVPVRITLYDNTGCTGNQLGQWTETFSGVNIAAGGGTQLFTLTPRNITTNLVTNSTNCLVSLRIEADYNDSICECDGTNNDYCTADKNVDIPDLLVTGDTLGITCLTDGQVTVSGTVTMTNSGCGSNLNANIPVRFTLYNNTGCAGSQLSQWTETLSGVNIAAGGGTQVFTITPRNITSNLVTNSTNCRVSLRIEADYNDSICESDGNNTYCADNKAVDIPDLQVSSDTLGVTCLADGQVTVSGTVTMVNNGCGSNLAANIPVRFILYDNTGCSGNVLSQWTETLTGVNIAAGGGSQSFTITAQNVTTNICTNSTGCQISILIEADYPGSICESDGTNNTRCSNKTVSIPDLTINSITPSFTCVSDGNLQGTVTVNVSNTGCGVANGAVVRLTSDCGITFTDQTINLAAGSSANVTFTYTPVCTACTCIFTATADPGNTVCECDGTNNTLVSAPFTMTVPDIEVQSDTLAVTCADDNQVTLSGTVTLVNNGCGANLTTDIPMRFTWFDNTGCSGNSISQWTQTFTGVDIASGGGTQAFTITAQTINTNLCTNSNNCRVSIRVEADYNNSVCECDGTDNTYCADNKAVDIPDLQIQSDALGVSCTTDGQVSVSGTVTMANTGCGSNLIANIPVRFTLFDNTGCTGNQLLQWTQTFTGVNIPSSGGTQAFTITPQNLTTNLVTNSTNCRVSILIEPDYTGTICECDSTNNNYCADNKPVDIPDLEIQGDTLGFTCIDDGQYRISGTVTLANNGCGSNLTANIAVRFTLNDGTGDGCTGGTLLQWTETFSGVNIPVGGTQTFTITAQDASESLCSSAINNRLLIFMEADYTNTICESDGTDNTLCSEKTVSIPELVINSVANTVICNSDGSLTGTTVNVSNIGNAAANGVVVRLTSDCGLTFSDQTVNLAAGETREVFFPFTSGIVTCTCNFTAVIDPDNTICECAGTNNTRTSTQDMLIPDLEIQDETLLITCLDDGMIRVSGTVTLINNGCGPDFTGNIPMRFTLFGRPGCSGSQVNQWTRTFTGVSIVSAGGTQTFTLQPHDIAANFCANSLNCRVSIRIEADYTDTICEWDGTDNTYCTDKTSDCLDLEAVSVTANTNCAEDAAHNGTITVTVRSSGGNPITQDFSIRVTDNQGWTSELRYHADLGGTLPLAAGASSTVTFPWNRTFDTSICQFANISAQVDSQNEICQCTVENDTATSSYQMPLANLRPTAITPSCSSDGYYLVKVSIENNGCSDAGPFTVHLEDNRGHSKDITIDGLAKGSTMEIEFTEWPATREGTVTFTAVVDAKKEVCEITGTDNTMSYTYTDTAPDLVISSVEPSTSCKSPGNIDGTITVTITNNGSGPLTKDFKIIIDDGQGWTVEQYYQADLNGTLPIPAGGTAVIPINWNPNFTKEPYTCNFDNITVRLDIMADICESAAGNNETAATYRMSYPDLSLESLLPMCQEDGQRQIQLVIKNKGCGDQDEDFNIIFSDSTGKTQNASFTSMGGKLPFKKGETQTINLAQWQFDCTGATTQYSAAISTEKAFCDLQETNNTLTLAHTMDVPDLLFGDIVWTCNADGSITFTVTVTNAGFGSANNVPVVVYDGNGNTVFRTTVTLAPGATREFSFTTGSYPRGQDLSFRFVVDENREFCECNGDNNEKNTTIRCEGGEPQLKLTKFCPPGQEPGGLFRFELQIENTGSIDLYNARIEDTLPEGFQYVKDSSALDEEKITDPQAGPPLVWQIGNLEKGASRTLKFLAVADADIDPGRYCNEAHAIAAVSSTAAGEVESNPAQCCTVVVRQAGEGCCLDVEEWLLSPGRLPDGPLSFIEPYFHTESAMYMVYAIFNLWNNIPLEKETLPLFMKERLRNYARSTIEEFYLGSRLGLTLPDGTLWLSYAGAYPDQENKDQTQKGWDRKQVDETMTVSQIGFELLALDKAVKEEERPGIKEKLKDIIEKKLTFLSHFIDDLPHAWEIKKDEVKVKAEVEDDIKVEEAIEKYVKKQDDKANLYDKAALYLAMVELNKIGYNNPINAGGFQQKLREMLKPIDNNSFDRGSLREELTFILALLQEGRTSQASAKIQEFERILATEAVGDRSLENTGDTEKTGEKLATKDTKKHEKTKEELLNNLHDYALAAAVDYKAGGTLYPGIEKEMKDRFYLKDAGVFADKQPDFTFKMNLDSLAPLVLSFDTKEPGQLQPNAVVLYRTFDEVGLFLKKRNLEIGKPLYSLLKNYPFSEPLLPILSFTKAKRGIAPVFSRDAVVHSTQVKPLGEILIPQTFSRILSPAHENETAKIAALSYDFQYFGKKLIENDERAIKEEGRSFVETGKKYMDSLLTSGAGVQLDGITVLLDETLAAKGQKQSQFNLEPVNSDTRFSTEALANYLLAEKLYIESEGKQADNARRIMEIQRRIVETFKEKGYIPKTFDIFMNEETNPQQFTIIPSEEQAGKITTAKLYQALGGEFFLSALKQASGELTVEDFIFLSSAPELVPYFEDGIQKIMEYRDAGVSNNAADIIGRRLLGMEPKKIAESVENLRKHWDKEAEILKSDRIENIEKGLIYHYEPQRLLLYLLALQDQTGQFRFKRTLNFFTYMLENEWGVEWTNSFITLPSMEYLLFREEPRENPEPGDLLNIKVRVDNTCPEGFGRARDLGAVYLKALFNPALVYMGTQPVDGLHVLGDFQWHYDGLPQGAVLEYIYQAYVPSEFNDNFIDGSIYAGGRQGFEDFGPDSGIGDRCEDIDHIRRLNFIPFEALQGLVFEDKNVNGSKEDNELGVPNILIKDTRGRMFRSDAEGRFTVMAGDEHEGLQLELKSLPATYVLLENPTRLVNRRYTGEIYFPLVPCETVIGFVYVDENQDGVYDEGEPRPEGVLLKAKDKEVITGKDGNFIFRNVPTQWRQWIEVKQEQLYYKGSKENLKFKIEEKQ